MVVLVAILEHYIGVAEATRLGSMLSYFLRVLDSYLIYGG